MKTKVSSDAVFGAHRKGTGKTGKPYNFMELSDGFEAVLFNTDLDPSVTQHLEKGTHVQVDLEIDLFSNMKKVLTIEAQ